MADVMVRMGELAVSRSAEDVLVSLGLGSCIGLALLDRRRGCAGLAHVVLPESAGAGGSEPGKFADTAVPQLIGDLTALGARRLRLEAVLVGGASMFGSQVGLDIGGRNRAAVAEALSAQRIPVVAEQTGGQKGRTVRVHVATTGVTVRVAGSRDTPLLAGHGEAAA